MAVHITQDADGMVDCLKVLEEQTQGHGFAPMEKGEQTMATPKFIYARNH
jgi:hypothetical protein